MAVDDLEHLPLEKLKRLQAAVADEITTRMRAAGDVDYDSLMQLWHEPIVDHCVGKQSFHAWKSGAGKHCRKHLPEAERFTDYFFKKGIRASGPERYFARLLIVQCVSDYLESMDITPTISVVTKNMGSAGDAVEHCMPGYARSGFLPAVYVRFTNSHGHSNLQRNP